VTADEQNPWYSQNAFWHSFHPVLFNQQRLSSAPSEVDQIVRLLALEQPGRVLDLCCGVGRHSLELSRRGFEVVGVDSTAEYIDRARKEAARNQVAAEFMVGDMREVCMPDAIDVAINLFGSFGYFEDQADDRRVVENMYSSLRLGGRLLIETMGKEILAGQFREREWSEEGGLLILSEKTISNDWSRVDTRWIVVDGASRNEYRVSVRSYSGVELSSLLRECGFQDVRVFGGLDGSAYDHLAKRLVVVGRK
jgi:SAM-dependent methyltransferase